MEFAEPYGGERVVTRLEARVYDNGRGVVRKLARRMTIQKMSESMAREGTFERFSRNIQVGVGHL
jgi:hypothetical protein